MATSASKSVQTLGQSLHKLATPSVCVSSSKFSTTCVDSSGKDVSPSSGDLKGAARLASLKKGSGYRSSFSGTVATVFGATGLVGRTVCNRLGKIGTQMIIPYHRDHYTFMRLKVCGDLGQVLFTPYYLKDEESIRKAMQHSNVVINLIGRQWETRNFSFEDVNIEGPARLARIAREMGVKRFIHISDINARENPKSLFLPNGSKYLRTKWLGEQRVLEEFPDATIFRPTEMFGPGDTYLRYYFSMGRMQYRTYLPLWKKGEETVKAPMYYSDLGQGIVNSITNPNAKGNIYEAYGPERYLMSELMDHLFALAERDVNEYGYRRVDLRLRPFFLVKAKMMDMMPIGVQYFGGNTLERLDRTCLTDEVLGLDNLEDLGVTPVNIKAPLKYECDVYREYAHHTPETIQDEIPIPPLEPISAIEERKLALKGDLNPLKLLGMA